MTNLNNAKAGRTYLVTWMLGDNADLLKSQYELTENMLVHVLQRYANGDVIISYDAHRLALNREAASAVRVEAA